MPGSPPQVGPGIQDAIYGQADPMNWRVGNMGNIEPPNTLEEWRQARGPVRGTLGYGQDVADYLRANNNLSMSRMLGGNATAYRFAQNIFNPPTHSLGWPYPGFNGDLHDSLNIPQYTPLGILPNALIYGHEHPETTLAGNAGQASSEFIDWLRQNNPFGWGR